MFDPNDCQYELLVVFNVDDVMHQYPVSNAKEVILGMDIGEGSVLRIHGIGNLFVTRRVESQITDIYDRHYHDVELHCGRLVQK